MAKLHIQTTINGEPAEFLCEPAETLLDALRNRSDLTGTKEGCSTGDCGACSVLMNGRLVPSCLVLAAEARGRDGRDDRRGGHRATRCIRCSSSFSSTRRCSAASARRASSSRPRRCSTANPNPTESEVRYWLAGNLCRCTGYDKIVRAVLDAADEMREASPYEPERTFTYVGTRPIRHDGLDKVTGRANYGADFTLPGMLHGGVLRSPHAHARIVSIDTSAAEALPGVKAIVTGERHPEDDRQGDARARADSTSPTWATTLLAHDKALYHGHAVAAVAATTLESGARGGRARSRWCTNALQPVITHRSGAGAGRADPARRAGDQGHNRAAGATTPTNVAMRMELRRGDMDKGFAEADVIVEHEFHDADGAPGIHRAARVRRALRRGRSGAGLDVDPGPVRRPRLRAPASSASMPRRSRSSPSEIGGGFGGKIPVYLEPLAVALSRKAHRPVKLVMTRDEVFRATGTDLGHARCG